MSTIRKAVPMPGTVRYTTGAMRQLDTLAGAEVGDSFHVPASSINFRTDAGAVDLVRAAKAMQSTLFYPSQKRDLKVRVRPVGETDPDGAGIRVWRVG